MMPSGSTLFVLFYRYHNRGAFDEYHTQAPVRRPSAGREARVRQQLCSSVSLSMIIFFFSAEVNINRDRMRLDEENFKRCGEASGDQARRGIKRAVTLAGREAGARRGPRNLADKVASEKETAGRCRTDGSSEP